jgi:MFS family permease
MKKLTSLGEIFVLNVYWIGLSVKWNALHPIILPVILLGLVPATQRNTTLGLITFTGLVVAMLVQPVAGAVSDGWRSRLGRRRPMMAGGTLFDVLFLALIAIGAGSVAGVPAGLALIFIGYVGLQVSSNTAQAPAQGLLADRVAPQKMGLASGIKTLLDIGSLVVVALTAGRLLDPEGSNPGPIFLLVILTMLVTAAITVAFTREEPTDERGDRPDWLSNLRGQLRVDFRQNTPYWWAIAQRFVFLLGVYGAQAFVQNYLRDALQIANPIKATADLLAAMTLTLVLMVVAGGWLSDRHGPKRVLFAAGMLVALGMTLLPTAHSMTGLLGFGSILGAGIGLFLTASWALANRLAPAQEAGKYLGLTNIATAGAAALARLQGPLIDLGNNARPGEWQGYLGMFVFGVVCALVSVVMLRYVQVPGPEAAPAEEQGPLAA